jgi:membrane associated rhomboid family serine protease
MAYGLSSTGLLPRAIKILLIANVAFFLLDYATHALMPNYAALPGGIIYKYMALDPDRVTHGMQVWRLLTYLFVHDQSPPFIHILFNMLMLWMFGVPLVHVMGERKFWWFYLSAGFFSALCSLIFYALTRNPSVIIGASGAIFGLMFAFAKFFPTQQFLMFFIFPVEARYAVLIIGGIELLLITSNDGIAHITHLGGALFAWLYFRYEDKGGLLLEKWKNPKAGNLQKAIRKTGGELREEMPDIDPILKKISQSGLSSLTLEEKEKLQMASELKRKQRSNVLSWEKYRNRS